MMITIGLIGDYNAAVTAHLAIPQAISLAAETQGLSVGFEWVPTDEISSVERVARFAGLWCVASGVPSARRVIRWSLHRASGPRTLSMISKCDGALALSDPTPWLGLPH